MTFTELARGSVLNLCMLLALVTLSGLVRRWFVKQHRSAPAWQTGLLFGAMAVVAMLFPVITRSGMIFDCRSGVLGAAGLVGGPMAALAGLPLPIAYRLYFGGAGTVPGLLEIVLPALLGSVCHAWFRRRNEILTMCRVFLSSLVVTAGSNGTIVLLIRLFMPESGVVTDGTVMALIFSSTAVSMTFLGSLILLERQHFDAVESLAESERRMRHSQKMAAIGQLSGKVAHSFMNALGGILGNAQMAKDKADAADEVRKHMDGVIESVGRVSLLAGELLAFAKPAPLKVRRMDLSKAVVGIREILTETIGPDIEVTIHSDTAGKVDMDPDQIEQVIVHVAVNSAEAMPGHGRLTVATSRADLSRAEAARLQAGTPERDRHRGAFALLSVSDTGCGMPEAVCSRIFEPYFTTKADADHAGLGLSTVYNIVQLHHGYIDVKSRDGRGTEFLIYLPIKDEPEA